MTRRSIHSPVWFISGALVLVCCSIASGQEDEYAVHRASQTAFRNVAQTLRPSLVRIETVGGSQPPHRLLDDPDAPKDEDGQPDRSPNLFRDAPGSSFVVADGPTTGIVYSSDGYIISSSFNFIRDPLVIWVTASDGRRFSARLIARDQVRKLALLKADVKGLIVPVWRDVENIQVGEWAVALGLGFGGDHPSVTAGIISARNRMLGNAVQTDAKLSPANYGGPLCDIQGRIIGICVPMAQRPGELAGVELYDAGVGFVLPKKRVDAITDTLRTGQSIYRGWLGISVDRRGRGGAVIRNVAHPSPMLSAGIEPGDTIKWAEGREVRSFSELVKAIYMIPAGNPVRLTFERDAILSTRPIFLGDKVHLVHQREKTEFGITVTLARNTELGDLPKPKKQKKP